MAHIVGAGFEIETLQEALTGHAVAQRTGAVCLQRGHDQILHDFDLGLPLQARFRLVEGSPGLRDIEPGFVLVETGLDIADALEVLVQFVRVGFGETALHASGFAEHGVEDAAVLCDGRLALFQRHVVGGEELVENLNRVVVASHRFAALIPGQGKSGAVTLKTGGVELDRGEASVLPQMLRDDLVGGDAVGHVLAGHRIAIGSSEPEGAAPVSFVGELVRTTLHHGCIGLVTSQRSEPLREFVVGAGKVHIRKPGLFGYAEASAEENAAFRGSDGRC